MLSTQVASTPKAEGLYIVGDLELIVVNALLIITLFFLWLELKLHVQAGPKPQ